MRPVFEDKLVDTDVDMSTVLYGHDHCDDSFFVYGLEPQIEVSNFICEGNWQKLLKTKSQVHSFFEDKQMDIDVDMSTFLNGHVYLNKG